MWWWLAIIAGILFFCWAMDGTDTKWLLKYETKSPARTYEEAIKRMQDREKVKANRRSG